MSRRARNPAVSALLILGIALPAGALADDFADFRIPKSREFGWSGSLSSDASQWIRDPQRDGKFRGMISSEAYWLTDSDPLYRDLLVSLGLQGDAIDSRRRQELGFPSAYWVAEDRTQASGVSESFFAGWRERHYLGEPAVGVELGLFGRGQLDQSWTVRTSDETRADSMVARRSQSIDATAHSYRRTFGIDLAMGVGRVRNATAVYEERVFEDRLWKTGALVRPLSRAARARLTALLFLGDSYGQVHDRPAKFL